MAHELKNPMTSIKGYTELLAAGSVGQVNDMQANFLNTIRSNVERMSALVSDLNDNAKIEANRLRLDFKPVEVADVVDEVMRSTKRQMDDKRQTLELQLTPFLPAVWADRLRVGQVLTNLMSNAHKYTPDMGRLCSVPEATNNQWDPEGQSGWSISGSRTTVSASAMKIGQRSSSDSSGLMTQRHGKCPAQALD